MKKTVKIEGLDCPNCARTLEAEINKIEGVKNAEINFVKGKLSFESEDINALQKIVELSKKIEPNAKIIDSKKKINNKKFSPSTLSLWVLESHLGFWHFCCLFLCGRFGLCMF